MREIELKARVRNLAAVKDKIEASLGKGGVVNKRDQYFHRPGEKKQAFRIRDNNGVMEFTTKRSFRDKDGENNLEYEFTADLGQRERAEAFFACLGYEHYYTKCKSGWEWMSDEVHVELLEVNDLGWFLEMEILIPFRSTKEDVQDAQFHLKKLMSRYGVRNSDFCFTPYRAMILGENVEDGV